MTAIPTSITHVLDALAAATDDIEEISFSKEDDSWAVRMRDQSEILVEWDDEPSRVLLSSLLGTAAQGRESSMYLDALAFNAQSRHTQGVTVGLGGAGGELMLMRLVFADGLLVQELQAALLDFHALSRAWVRYVSGDADRPPVPHADDEAGADPATLASGAPQAVPPLHALIRPLPL